EPLIGVRPIDVGGVDEIHAEVERALQRRNRLAILGGAVTFAHAHAAEPERSHERSAAPELSPLKIFQFAGDHEDEPYTWNAKNSKIGFEFSSSMCSLFPCMVSPGVVERKLFSAGVKGHLCPSGRANDTDSQRHPSSTSQRR